jgi:hypothetical protein
MKSKNAVAPITEPDTSCEDLAYWETVLKSHSLGVNAGRPRGREVSFVGTSNNLVGIENEQQANKVSKDGRRVCPQGHGPD